MDRFIIMSAIKYPSAQHNLFQRRAQALRIHELELLAQAEGYLCADVPRPEVYEEVILSRSINAFLNTNTMESECRMHNAELRIEN